MAGATVRQADESSAISLSSAAGRWIVLACVLGSGIAGIDATVVNIALPDIGRSLHVGFASLQWTVTAYTLTLASLILLGGSLGDRFGRRRVFVIGVAWFGVASVLCAPDILGLSMPAFPLEEQMRADTSPAEVQHPRTGEPPTVR